MGALVPCDRTPLELNPPQPRPQSIEDIGLILPSLNPCCYRSLLKKMTMRLSRLSLTALGFSLLNTMVFGHVLSVSAQSPNEPAAEEADVVVEPVDNPRFSCQSMEATPTVAYSPVEQPNQQYAWAAPRSLGGGWTAERRCAEISRRLEEYRPDGLVELSTGMENGYDTICVTTEDDPTCRIVLTVPPGQDPIATRDSVFNNLTLANSGQQTQGVPTLQDRNRPGNILGDLRQVGDIFGVDLPGGGAANPAPSRSNFGGINLRPFLAPSDRGTGEQLNLRSSAPTPTTPANRRPTPQGLPIDFDI